MEIIPRSPNMPQGLHVHPVRLVLGAIGALGIIVTLFSRCSVSSRSRRIPSA
jgi:hypothetical protein